MIPFELSGGAIAGIVISILVVVGGTIGLLIHLKKTGKLEELKKSFSNCLSSCGTACTRCSTSCGNACTRCSIACTNGCKKCAYACTCVCRSCERHRQRRRASIQQQRASCANAVSPEQNYWVGLLENQCTKQIDYLTHNIILQNAF